MLEQQKREEVVPWTIQQTFLGVFLTLIPWVVFSLGLSGLSGDTPASTTPLTPQIDTINAVISFVFGVLVEAAFLIAPFYIARRATRELVGEERRGSIWRLLGFRSFRVKEALLWIVLLLLLILVVDVVYGYLIDALKLNLQTNDQRILSEGKIAPITTYALLVASIIVAPFCEEIFFRSFVFMGLKNGMAVSTALVMSALIFGVAHADFASFPVLLIIGVELAFLRWRTQSIWPGIILHMLNNTIGVASIVLALHGISIGI